MSRAMHDESDRSPKALLVVVLTLILGPLTTHGTTEAKEATGCGQATGQFVVDGSQICDPEGKPWMPRGVNITGANGLKKFASAHHNADYYREVWNLNAIRLNYCEVCVSHAPGTQDFGDLDELIEEYTARKMVVMIDNHEGKNGDPNGQSSAEVQWAIDFFTDLATRYKDNSYVWFELFNEPLEEGGDNKEPVPHWREIHEEVASAIRATGSENIIVMNASHFGQDRYSNEIGGFRANESSILTYGPALSAEYGNVVFDVHVYSRWQEAGMGLQKYFDAVHAAGLAILVGETGGSRHSRSRIAKQDWRASVNLYQLKPAGVGIFNWYTYASKDARKRMLISGENNLVHAEWTHNPPSPVVPIHAYPNPETTQSSSGCAVRPSR
jgi:mannan endo-1,4-beta-mannosidase